jgi:hypothetical protein
VNDLEIPLTPLELVPKGVKRTLLRRIKETEDFVLEIDNSSLEYFNVCSRAAQHYLVDGKEKSDVRSSLIQGGAHHKGQEIINRVGVSQESVKKGVNAIADYYKEELPVIPEGEWRTPNRVIEDFEKYCKFYQTELWKVLEKDSNKLVEVPFAIPLGEVEFNGTPMNNGQNVGKIYVVWTGKVDLMIEWEDQNWVVDHKTSSIKGEHWWNQYTLSQPIIGYVWAAQRITGKPFVGAVINGIFLRKPSRTGVQVEFERRRFYYEPWRIMEWEKNTMVTVSDFLAHLKRGFFPQETVWCVGKYGLCQYFDVCTAAPQERKPILDSPKYRDVTWSPLENK